MKKIISVSLGPSNQDYELKTRFLDEEFSINRIGTDGNEGLAWEKLQRLQAKCDVVGIGMVGDNYFVANNQLENTDTQHLAKVVTRVPVTTGARVRRILQYAAVRHVQKKLGNYFNNNKVLFLSGLENYEMAQSMKEYTSNIVFADLAVSSSLPLLVSNAKVLEAFALLKSKLGSIKLPKQINFSLPWIKKHTVKRITREIAKSHVIVGTCQQILHYGNNQSLQGKTLITSCVTDEHFKAFKAAKVNFVIDVTPEIFDRPVGVNVLEAMIIASLGRDIDEISSPDLYEIIKQELELKPRLLYPTGEFRDIRRFAFVIHPLSREYLRNVNPLTKKYATPKILQLMEKLIAYSPPFVYTEVKNIKSPTGAEAEGWLITVGGTPKEMLSHSPEFTYRRLLAAAKKAEKLGAQIMGLGAFTKVVGDAGVTVAKRSDLPITTGNSYSASCALWAAADAMRRMKLIAIPTKGKKLAAKTMVVGATGAIGSVSARLLAMAFDEVYLAGRNMTSLERLKTSMLEDTPDAKIVCTTDYDSYLHKMDMIVTSTSGAGKKILDITKVKPGCVITDVARPLDLPPSEVAKRPDVLVIESGEIELPVSDKLHMKDIKLPPNVVFACMAETIVLALEGRFEVFTIGRNTEWEKVKEIYKLGIKHGMKLAAISGVNGAFTEQDIQKVRDLALEARKTWQPPQPLEQQPEQSGADKTITTADAKKARNREDRAQANIKPNVEAAFNPFKEGSKKLKSGYKYVGGGVIEEVATGKRAHKSAFEAAEII